MKTRIIILISSVIISMAFIAAGYGFWEEALTITGHITVTRPEDTISRVIAKVVSPGAIEATPGAIDVTPGAIGITHGAIGVTPGAIGTINPDSIGAGTPSGSEPAAATTSEGIDIASPGSTGAGNSALTGSSTCGEAGDVKASDSEDCAEPVKTVEGGKDADAPGMDTATDSGTATDTGTTTDTGLTADEGAATDTRAGTGSNTVSGDANGTIGTDTASDTGSNMQNSADSNNAPGDSANAG